MFMGIPWWPFVMNGWIEAIFWRLPFVEDLPDGFLHVLNWDNARPATWRCGGFLVRCRAAQQVMTGLSRRNPRLAEAALDYGKSDG